MCNNEEDFCGIAKYKPKYTKVDKYIIGLCLCGLTLAVLFAAVVLYQLILSLV
jgi:hypothetical protein